MAKPLVAYAPYQLVLNGGAISYTPTVTQGTGFTWTAFGLPSGGSVNSSTGAITGTLSATGRWITELVGRNAEFATGEADSGSTTTAVDSSLAALTYSADLFDKFILFTSGSNSGALRKITAYNAATKTITFGRALSATVASGDDFVILGPDDFYVQSVAFVGYSSVVTIDAAWLADTANQHDDGWKIEGGSVNNSHKIFRLDQDVTSTKTAFWIADEYVHLDLNGFAIHYGGAGTAREYGVALYTKEFFTDTTYVGVVQTPEIANRTAPQFCSIVGGSIINDATGDRTHAIGCHRGYDLLLAETVVETAGKDSCAINVYSSGRVYLLNNALHCNLTATFDRHAGPSIVQLNGTAIAEGNLITGQNSGFNFLSTSVARRNVISQAGEFTNGYSFFLYRTSNIEIYDNICIPTNGRGVLLNGGGTPLPSGNAVTKNLVLHLEEGNVEFGTALNPPAYRIRYGTGGNLFASNKTLGIGGGSFCGTSAIYITTYSLSDSEDLVQNNDCDVIAISLSGDLYANSITFEGTGGPDTSYGGGLVSVRDNLFRSNCYHIRTEGYDGCTQQETAPRGNTFEWVDGDTALATFFDAVDAKLLELGLEAGVLSAAQDQRDVVYAIADAIAGVDLQATRAFWFVKYISHNNLLSFCDLLDSTYGTGVDPETYTYQYSTLSTGSARYREGVTAEIEVLLAAVPVANTELTVTTPQGDSYTVETDGDGIAEFVIYNFAIEKANASGATFSLTDRTFSTVTLGGDSAIIEHSSVPPSLTLEDSPPTPPINTVAPVASGTPIDAETVSCTQGTWDNAPDTYAYQWFSNSIASASGGDAIVGATSATYDLTTDEIGLWVYCVVTATNVDGAADHSSNVLGPVLPVPTVSNPNIESYTTARRITATTNLVIDKPSGVVAGDLLILIVNIQGTLTTTCSGFTSFATSVGGSTVLSVLGFYKVAGGSEPSNYTIAVSGGGGNWCNAGLLRISGAISPLTNAIEVGTGNGAANPSVAPTVTPSDAASLVLRACATGRTNGVITVTPATQVFIDSVSGELPHLAVSQQDADNSAVGTANFTQPNAREYAALTIALAPAAPPAPANTVAPAVIGIATEGETLETDNGTWTDASSYAYQWVRNAAETTVGGTEISGETAATYELTADDVGEYVYCEVTATNVTGSTAAFSNIAGPIAAAPVPPENTVTPVASGIAEVGETLTCTEGTWNDATEFDFDWYRNPIASNLGGSPIDGAIASTYEITIADDDFYIYCVVTATGVGGQTEEPSNVVGPVGGDPPPAPIAPTITTDAALYVLEGRALVRGMSATGDEPIAWSLTGGADVALFEIVEATGALSFLVAPVYASPTDANADGVYIVEVTAENDGGDDAKTLSIHVLRRPTRPNMGANRKGRR